MCQNYTKFEFNSNLLLFLANEMFSGKYGTFLFNNENEREAHKAKEKTISIWNQVYLDKKYFLNHIYEPKDTSPLYINYKRIQLWKDYFYQFEKGGKEEDYIRLINKIIDKRNKKIDKKRKIIQENDNFIDKISILINDRLDEKEKEILGKEIVDKIKQNAKKNNYGFEKLDEE